MLILSDLSTINWTTLIVSSICKEKRLWHFNKSIHTTSYPYCGWNIRVCKIYSSSEFKSEEMDSIPKVL